MNGGSERVIAGKTGMLNGFQTTTDIEWENRIEEDYYIFID